MSNSIYGDPISQTFFVKRNVGLGSDVVFISKIELFFQRKSDTRGVGISLRRVVNGYPKRRVIPFSDVFVEPENVSVSDDASLKTEFVFDNPIPLKVGKEYAITIHPEGNNSDYLIWTSVAGQDCVLSCKSTVSDWGDGKLFTATNNDSWKPSENEDLKFKVYRKNFKSTGTSTAILDVSPSEFLEIQNVKGRYSDDELVYAKKSVNLGVVSVQEGSDTISGTSFTTNFAVKDLIVVERNSDVDVLTIEEIVSPTELKVKEAPYFTATNCQSFRAVGGYVAYYDFNRKNRLYLHSSNARSSNKFEDGDTLIGEDSGATSDIKTNGVLDIQVSYMQPHIYKINDQSSLTDMRAKPLYYDEALTSFNRWVRPINDGDDNTFNSYTRKTFLRSKSNDVAAKSMWLEADFSNTKKTSSPVIDFKSSGVMLYEYEPETTRNSGSFGYVSKTVTLKDGFDAEDFRLFLSGHRPRGTDIDVYLKVKSANDPNRIDDKPWIKLQKKANVFTSRNVNDYREFEYDIPADSLLQEAYKYFAVKIVLYSSEGNGIVPFVKEYRALALT